MSTGSLIDLIFRLKASCMADELDIMLESGLSPAEFHGLEALEPGERVAVSIVAKKMSLSPSRTSRVVEKMVQKGFIVRETDPEDRRRCTVYLDKKGMEVKKQIQRQKMKCEEYIQKKLSPEDIRTLSVSLKKLIDIM